MRIYELVKFCVVYSGILWLLHAIITTESVVRLLSRDHEWAFFCVLSSVRNTFIDKDTTDNILYGRARGGSFGCRR